MANVHNLCLHYDSQFVKLEYTIITVMVYKDELVDILCEEAVKYYNTTYQHGFANAFLIITKLRS